MERDVLGALTLWLNNWHEVNWPKDHPPNAVRLSAIDYERLIDQLIGERRLPNERPSAKESLVLNMTGGQVLVMRDLWVNDGYATFLHHFDEVALG